MEVLKNYNQYIRACRRILQENKGKVRASTFNIFVKNESETEKLLQDLPNNCDFIVGINYTLCEKDCKVCKAKAARKSDYIQSLKELYGFCVTDQNHMKYFSRGNMAIVGGFNISESGYTDMALLVECPTTVKKLNKNFDNVFKSVHKDNHTFKVEKPIITFGKYKGLTLEELVEEDYEYYNWFMTNVDQEVLNKLTGE